MEQFILPSTFTWQEGTKPHERTLTVEPCYFGYGTTLGNAMRRALLSSLTGAAATAAKIDGVAHEFSTITHVQEDVMQILLNLKQLRMKVFTDEPVRLILDVSGKREVTAGDITPQSDVEIVNPDLHLATLTHADAALHVEIFARRGRGYSTTDARDRERLELGTMAIDAVFTPIRNVGFRVENTRVGEITNYDRLILTVETDGTMTPEEAVHQAARTLIDHFTLILEPPTEQPAEAIATPVGPEIEPPAEDAPKE
ncbi:MAG: DNA-directed RNA polymerase subunit alpha [bacterium]|nr:DNA-directed RNA polymerase subunit alpha [bacterium]